MDSSSLAVIIVAVIGAMATILSNIVIARSQSKDVAAKLDKQQAVTDTKIEELTREVREHNDFAKRVPLLEVNMKNIEDRLSSIAQKVG